MNSMFLPYVVGAIAFLVTEATKRGLSGWKAQVLAVAVCILGGVLVVILDGGLRAPNDAGGWLSVLGEIVPKIFITAQLIYALVYKPVQNARNSAPTTA